VADDTAGHGNRRPLDEAAGLLVRRQQALHFRAHGLFSSAGGVEERRALGRLALERIVE